MSEYGYGEYVPPVRVSSGGESGWGEAGMYGPPEPVAAAIKVEDVIVDDNSDDDDEDDDDDDDDARMCWPRG